MQQILDKLSIYMPQTKTGNKPVGRLIKLGEKRDWSANYIDIQAILQYHDQEAWQ